jgi:hypothetical protein
MTFLTFILAVVVGYTVSPGIGFLLMLVAFVLSEGGV